jgi:hypothetical protein
LLVEEDLRWFTARGSQKGGGARNRPVLQRKNKDGSLETVTMAEAREDYGFRSEALTCLDWKADITLLEDRLQEEYQPLPLGKRCWRWVAMGDHGYNQVEPKAHMLFVAYSWDVADLILSGEIVVVP